MDAITLRESLDIAHIAILGGLTLLLLLFSAMASASEVAFFSLTHNDLADLEARNTASSRRLLDLLDNGDRLLATILVTNNMVNICLVIVATQLADALFIFSSVWEFVFNTIVITFLLLLFGEIMPKVLSQTNPIKMATLVSGPLKILQWLVYPLAFILIRT